MLDWLKRLSANEMAFMFCAGFVVLTVIGILVCRPYSRRFIHSQRNANDMIGFALASFATLYGILLGLLAVEAYQDFSSAKDSVSKNAVTMATLFNDLDGLPPQLSSQLKTDLHAYADEALETLWPKDPTTPPPVGPSPNLHRMLDRLLAFKPSTKSEELVHEEGFHAINTLIEQRRLLISSSSGGIPGALWVVVALGAFLYLLLMCLFAMELHVHIVLGSSTALFLGAVVFLIAALDNPFRGGVTVDPTPIRDVRDAVAVVDQ